MKTLIALLLFAFSVGAGADDARPVYLSLSERQPLVYALQWRIPPTVSAYNLPAVMLPDHCINLAKRHAVLSGKAGQLDSLAGQRLYQCKESLAGANLRIDYPAFNPLLASLVKYHALSGENHTHMLAPGQHSWSIPEAENTYQVAKDYTLLGIQHIWQGTDHLLFLLCLIWIAGTWRRIVLTVTGFTLSHSITLALSALGVVQLPVPPVEAVIALSIVFLATEMARSRRDSLTWRYPVAISMAFGLLHGLGFAAVLDEIGLPQLELVTGLLFFNVGVEIGQLVFVAAVACAMAIMRSLASCQSIQSLKHQHAVRLISSYTIGVVAMYWMAERCAQFVQL